MDFVENIVWCLILVTIWLRLKVFSLYIEEKDHRNLTRKKRRPTSKSRKNVIIYLHQAQMKKQPNLPRTCAFWEDDVQKFDDNQWLEHFRMPCRIFDIIIDLVAPDLAPDPSSIAESVPLEKRVAIALWVLTSTSEVRTVACLFGVAKSTVFKFFHIFLRFVHVTCHDPGSSHDATVLRGSSLWSMAQRHELPQATMEVNGRQMPLALAGDAAYPLQTWLMKAYPTSQENDPAKARFNMRLGAARVVVEHAFGRLKCRWRRILKRSEHSYRYVPSIAFVAVILHNILEENATPLPTGMEDHDPGPFEQPPTTLCRAREDDPAAATIRDILKDCDDGL